MNEQALTEHLLGVLRAPYVSEKSARVQESGQYVFEIASSATKIDVKKAVESLFGVQVLSVNVVNIAGKSKAFRFRSGARSGKRKAYVRLAEGQTIDVMAKA
jgi:large subunit ribosomal protein L23